MICACGKYATTEAGRNGTNPNGATMQVARRITAERFGSGCHYPEALWSDGGEVCRGSEETLRLRRELPIRVCAMDHT